MAEKLIIKNLGPIRQVEIDLKKVNIFIGPQGSGKSTIAKIISAVISHVENRKLKASNEDLKAKLIEDLNLISSFETDTSIIIKSINGDEQLLNKTEEVFTVAEPSMTYQVVSDSMYIPAERTLIPLIAGASFFFIREKTPIPKYVTDFGLLFQKARADIKTQKFNFLDEVTYHYRDGRDLLELKNGKTILLSESSNGMQTTVPLLVALSWLTSKISNKAGDKNIYVSIEEPELSLFPGTQNDLLQFIFGKINSLKYNLTITTHSPYTLSVFNKMLYASQVGMQHAEAAKEVVPENLWLNPDDVGVWYVENGSARSIMDEETKLIKVEEIDRISEDIGDSLGKLARIKMKGA